VYAGTVLRGLSLALLILLPLAYPALGLHSVAGAREALLESTTGNGTLTVETVFYSVKFNVSVGGLIEDLTLKTAGGEVDVFDQGLPSPFGSTIYLSGGGGEVIEIELSRAEWEISVLENTSKLLVASFTPSLEGYNASVDVRVIASFRASIPYFTFLLAVTNRGDSDLSLAGPEGGVAMGLGFTAAGGNVSFAVYTIAGGYRPLVFENESTITWVFGGRQSTLLAVVQAAGPGFVVMARPLDPVPSRAVGVSEANASSITIVYGNATLGPKEARAFSLDIGYIPAEPVPLALAGIGDAVEGLGGNLSLSVERLLELPDLVEEMNETIRSLEERVDSLSNQVENLTETLEEYRGIESFYKSDIRKYQNQVERLRSELRDSGQRLLAGIAVGVILGFVGGLVARRRY
jgi:hypothetical protein